MNYLGARLRLSTSLQRNILEATVGGILNRFIMRSRRNTLFFEDIIGEYVRTCERYGRGEDLRKLSQRWGELTFQQLTPWSIKKLPTPLIINSFGKETWSNLGIVDDIHLDEEGDIVSVTTKNESITRTIGKNDFMPGLFKGSLSALYNSRLRIINVSQTIESCVYQFELEHEPIIIKGKEKSLYNRLNYLEPIKGFTLNDALKSNILQLKGGNAVYFRGKRLIIAENTIFHLVGTKGFLFDKVPHISHDFFETIIKEDSTDEQKLTLLKNLLQIIGWGIIKIVIKNKNEIFIEIKNPPYGLQLEKDNWHVLTRVILGYLWLLNEDFEIADVEGGYQNLKITYLSE